LDSKGWFDSRNAIVVKYQFYITLMTCVFIVVM